jgi:hypothetical protein
MSENFIDLKTCNNNRHMNNECFKFLLIVHEINTSKVIVQ